MADNNNIITSKDGKSVIRINTPAATLKDIGDAKNIFATVEIDGVNKLAQVVYALGFDGISFEALTESLKIGTVADGDYSEFELDGTLIAKGEATCWDDLSNAIIAARLDVASGRLDYDYFNGGVSFQSNARYPEEPVVIPVQAKHAMQYGVGAVARPHFHWLQQQAARPNMLLGYKITNYGETTTFETDFSNYTLLTPVADAFTYTSGTLAQITAFSEIDLSGLGLSGSIDFVLFRDSANVSGLFAGADPVAGNVTVKYNDSHVKFNMFGSRDEYLK